jgi:hypothetical protein
MNVSIDSLFVASSAYHTPTIVILFCLSGRADNRGNRANAPVKGDFDRSTTSEVVSRFGKLPCVEEIAVCRLKRKTAVKIHNAKPRKRRWKFRQILRVAHRLPDLEALLLLVFVHFSIDQYLRDQNAAEPSYQRIRQDYRIHLVTLTILNEDSGIQKPANLFTAAHAERDGRLRKGGGSSIVECA